MFPLVSGVVMLCHGPEFLLLFWGQDLTEVMPQREMRQPEVHAHRVDLGLEPNALFGMGAQQRLHRVLLALIESKLLKTLMEVCFEAGEAVGSMLRWLGQSW